MNNRYPYVPDMNPPPGMPRGYPYGPTPMPTSNPMQPSINPSFSSSSHMAHTPLYPHVNASATPFPSYPTASYSAYNPSSYPSAIPSYPSMPVNNSHSSPACNMPYPSTLTTTNPVNISSPYPSASSYPSDSASYFNMHAGYPPVNSGLNYHASGSIATHQPSFQRRHQNMAYLSVCEGTVKPYPDFDPKQDSEVLRKAMKGFGTDEKAIISILAKRSNSQRVYIGVAFKQLYGKDLIHALKSELSGNFEDVIVALMTPVNDYLASEVHRAISGIGTDEDVLIEILCTRTNQEIWAINEAYRRLYGKSMEDDIRSDTSGHFQRLLVSACTGARSEAPADETRAKQNAHSLYAAGVGQWGTDESVFNSILVAESFQQLALTFYEYQKLAGHTVVEAINKEMSGDLKKGMLAIAQCVENRPFYFAEKLYKAMKGLGTDDRTLIRIVVSRCEIDMMQIKAEYERNFGKPLADAISGDTSGDYRRVLIALIDGY